MEGDDAETVRDILNNPVRSNVIGHWLPLFDGPCTQRARRTTGERG